MPLCRDCAHCLPQDGQLFHARCERLSYVDLVSGETRNLFCSEARTTLGDCGPGGKLFVPAAAFAEADATIGAAVLAG